MTRILRDSNKKGVGAPRGKATGVSQAAMGGGRVSKDVAGKFSVRRLIARNPAKGVSANIGTKRDIGLFTNDPDIPNVTAKPNPRVLSSKGPRNSVAKGLKGFRDRAANRSIKRLK
jgi:hypothetical protein